MSNLPYPRNRREIQIILNQIDDRLLDCTEKFIELQIKRPTQKLISDHQNNYSMECPEAEWFNIYSIYRSNQQLNEGCNKLWATTELLHVTNPRFKKKEHILVGELFNRNYLQGTLIPTLYFSQISTLMSLLSSFGFIFLMINSRQYLLIRTQDGWKIYVRVWGARAARSCRYDCPHTQKKIRT